MKWFHILLGIYLALLSMLPCTDACEDHSLVTTTIASADHENHSHVAETCSPFCGCLCCGQFVNTPLDAEAPIATLPQEGPELAVYRSGHSHDVDRAIWQPPQA